MEAADIWSQDAHESAMRVLLDRLHRAPAPVRENLKSNSPSEIASSRCANLITCTRGCMLSLPSS